MTPSVRTPQRVLRLLPGTLRLRATGYGSPLGLLGRSSVAWGACTAGLRGACERLRPRFSCANRSTQWGKAHRAPLHPWELSAFLSWTPRASGPLLTTVICYRNECQVRGQSPRADRHQTCGHNERRRPLVRARGHWGTWGEPSGHQLLTAQPRPVAAVQRFGLAVAL